MRSAKTIAKLTGVLTAAALALASPASADFGDNFGFADINSPGNPTAPAYPGTEAIWAGTCDLSSADTSEGGVGTAPAIRPHCIDLGVSDTGEGGEFWPIGGTPQWRLRPVAAAGAHPDGTAAFFFTENPQIEGMVEGSVKNILVKLPPGVVGNPEAVQKCPAFAAQAVPPACEAKSQAGISTLAFANNTGIGSLGPIFDWQTAAVYTIEARDTVTAEFSIGNVASYFNIPITARGRTNGDYGVDTLALLIPDFATISGQAFTFWGVPWADEHTKWRADGLGEGGGLPQGTGYEKTGWPVALQRPYDPSWGPIKPFFTNPTWCGGSSLPVVTEIDSWQKPVIDGFPWIVSQVFPDPIDDCENVEFDPTITLKPTVDVSDSPSGLDVTLSVPQNNDPPADVAFDSSDDTGAPAYWKTAAGRATGHLKDTTVQLPAGTSFNPAAANGLRGCTTAQIGLTATVPKATFNNDPHQCPDTAKIGTLKIVSPLLPDPLFGDVYAAPQHDNPFPGSLTSIYLVAQDEERGLSVKLAGKVDLDPATGQISTTFVDNPQLPFNLFELHFKTGPRAPLNTPPVCGQFKNSVGLIPWSFPQSGPEPVIEDPFPIASMPNGLGCVTEPEDRVFGPGFEAGTTSVKANSYTHFVLNVSREDGHQEVSSLGVDLPPGVTANLTETPYCPEYAIEAAKQRSGQEETLNPSCPASSRMGEVTALAGAGPLPLPTKGQLYIAGPYDPDGGGPQPLAPFSVVVVTPAIAGGTPDKPAFDLGNVVIRSAGYVDRKTAQVNIASTKLPYIVGGVPLRIRKIMVAIEKPNFMLNPTNCSEMAVGGNLGGAADPLDPNDDSSKSVSNRFQVDGCKDLGFKPTLKLRLIGGTKRADYQRLKATLTARPGDANISKAEVTLPRSSFLAQEHIRTICTRVQFAANACPAGSIYGKATAYTPLLKDPLTGPVYLRASDNPLPDMVATLSGQFDIELVGRIDSYKKGIRSTFDVVPDAPVTKFELEMFGGKRSLIVNSKDICRSKNRAIMRFNAHNGASLEAKPKVANSCKKARKGKRKGAKGRKRAR